MVIVNAIIQKKDSILTVKRNKEPYKGMYGLPGGHVGRGESKETALIRELREETNSEIQIISCLGNIKNKGHTIYVYRAKIKSSKPFKKTKEISGLKWLKISYFMRNLKKYGVENMEVIETLVRHTPK